MHRQRSMLCLAVFLSFRIGFCPSNIAAQNVHENIQLPNPTGPYGIGRVSYDWIDEHRSDPSNNGAKREIMVDIWYPADVPQGASTAPLLPGSSRLTGISEEIMRDGQFKQAWPAVRSGAVASHAVANAPVAKKINGFPVLIFSPGLGSPTYAYTSQLEDFASHGYFVAAIEHTYDTPAVIFPDGRIVPFANDLWSRNPEPSTPGAEGEALHRKRTELWAEDIVFVSSRLASLNGDRHSLFHRRVDLNRVGAFGHSSGGRAAARACQLDHRIKACLSEDGNWFWEPFWLDSSGKSMVQPFMMLDHRDADPPDSMMVAHGIDPVAYRKKRSDRQSEARSKIYGTIKGGSYEVTIATPGVSHGSFTDLLFLRSAAALKDTSVDLRVLSLERMYVRAFFDKYLNRESTTLLETNNSKQSKDSDVIVQAFGAASHQD
jgi:predicted dienelactone hydrolase